MESEISNGNWRMIKYSILTAVLLILISYGVKSSMISSATAMVEDLQALGSNTISAECDEFKAIFTYSNATEKSLIILDPINAISPNAIAHTGSDQSLTDVCVIDIDSTFSNLVYISSNSQVATSYSVSDGTTQTSYQLSASEGFVIIVNRSHTVTFYDESGNVIY